MASHDFSDLIAQLRGGPDSRWTASFSIDWRVLAAFSDDLDGRIAAAAKRSGARLWSEDRGTRRMYHLEGAGRDLLAVLEMAQRDVNQSHSTPLKVWGPASFVSEMQYQLAARCAGEGIDFEPTVYPAGWRKAIMVATLRGPLADVRLLMWDVAETLARAGVQAAPSVPRPGNPPIPKSPETDLAVA